MSFPQFAFNNVRRNARQYFAYLLSSSFMVMIFFTYAVFIYHPAIENSPMGTMTRTGMTIATVIVYVFAFLFVLYSISVFLKSRNREFGILTILGAEAKQINWLIFLENVLIGAIAIVTGIASGMLLSKVFLLISTKVIDMDELPFYWPFKAMLLTAGAFTALFLVISLFTLLFIRKNQVLELLKGTSKPKTEPKANLFLAILGVVLLTIGFTVLRVKELDPVGLMIAAVTGIMGTYFFYSQLSVWVVRMLQRNRATTWKGTNLLWISEMSYKIKDNARMLFLVTVVVALASMSTGFVLAMQQSIKSVYLDNPYALNYSYYSNTDETKAQEELARIENRLQAEGLSYKRAGVETIYYRLSANGEGSLHIMPQSHYDHLAAITNAKPVGSLGENEALLAETPNAAKKSKGTLTETDIELSGQSYSFSLENRTDRIAAVVYSGRLLVVTDTMFEELRGGPKADEISVTHTYPFILPDSQGLPQKDDPETKLGLELSEWNRSAISEGYIESRAENYYTNKQGFSLFSFIGVFVALIFSISTASFLYFKLHTELSADQAMYRSLSKIGLSAREMNISATVQIAVLFFIPILVAALQSLVVLDPILGYLDVPNVNGPVLAASSAFLAAQMVYFLIARARYIKSVNRMMV
ncbi:ABC transporter permease protein YxdM [Paenibacillus sp. GM2FR]|uniref:ABC transporter permease n=1 Tax=Paenibacillus sp. GM2FR TaxID=2059268 RepID=UPI000C27EC54|nr:ABC transporter permease [Paenibacillus sp. GM2FR]PJN49356.1 ABC transporter permease protein YxdM [Paenibacillus sp. GM2FR]